jgi:Ca2+-binding EF-hand superfamily protein
LCQQFFCYWWGEVEPDSALGRCKQQLEKVQRLFDDLDDNGDGVLDRQEFMELARSLGVTMSPRAVDGILGQMGLADGDSINFLNFLGERYV